MKYLFYILPALAGITITTQAGVNSQLRVAINNPWVAAFVSFLVGTVILGLIIIGTKQPIPSFEQIKGIQLYKYSGGLLGAFFVTVVIFTVQRIGSANVFALVIASQFIVALLYDHFGLFGLPQTNISWVKILGSVMLIAGAYLVIKK
ncbi:MAG: DMT family transporter [Bacteroidota bacterium]